MLVFLFTDIEGSSRLWEEHTGVMTGIIARHDEILRQQVQAVVGARIPKPLVNPQPLPRPLHPRTRSQQKHCQNW